MPAPLPVDRVAYLRLRRTARVVTAVVAVPAVYLAVRLVALARAGDPAGALAFFLLGVYLAGAFRLCRWCWRISLFGW